MTDQELASTRPGEVRDYDDGKSTELQWVNRWARLLDTKFTIPGTEIRFGADFLMGLVPGAGDLLSMGFSAVLIKTMAQHGASPILVLRMLANVALDTIVGTVPLLGNVFDLFYKANYRNAQLMREYYDEGKHTGPIWPVLTGIAVFFVVLLAVTVWLLYWIATRLIALF